MNRGVKLLDTVALLEDVQAEEVLLQRGEVGAVVENSRRMCMKWNFVMTRDAPMHSPVYTLTNYLSCITRVRKASPHRGVRLLADAMMAGCTEHVWSPREMWLFRVPSYGAWTVPDFPYAGCRRHGRCTRVCRAAMVNKRHQEARDPQ